MTTYIGDRLVTGINIGAFGIYPYFRGIEGVFLPTTVNYIAEGDSITVGLGVGDSALSYPALAVQNANINPPVYYPLSTGGNWWTHTEGNALPGIVASSGITLLNEENGIEGAFETRGVYTGYDATKELNVASVLAGTNDGVYTMRLQVYRGLRRWARKARARGYDRLIIGTHISRSDVDTTNFTFDGNTLDLNNDIRENWSGDLGFDAISDFAALPGLDTAVNYNTDLTADKLHPNGAAYALMWPVHRDSLNAVVAAPGVRTIPAAIWSIYDCSYYLGIDETGRTTQWNQGGFGDASVRSLIGRETGKWYWELVLEDESYVAVGMMSLGFETYQIASSRGLFNNPNVIGAGYGGNNGDIRHTDTDGVAASVSLTTQPAFNDGDVLEFAFDADSRLYWYRVVGNDWNGNALADPTTGVGGIDLSGLGEGSLYPTVSIFAPDGRVTSRFDSAQMTGTIPDGFLALNAT